MCEKSDISAVDSVYQCLYLGITILDTEGDARRGRASAHVTSPSCSGCLGAGFGFVLAFAPRAQERGHRF